MGISAADVCASVQCKWQMVHWCSRTYHWCGLAALLLDAFRASGLLSVGLTLGQG
jgi:hypothetical protein